MVFVSSHLMSEMEHTADHLLVIGRGRLIADCGMTEFTTRGSGRVPLEQAVFAAVSGFDHLRPVPHG